MTHSKTPWSVEYENGTLVIDTYQGVVCTTELPDDASLIVSCVNAIGSNDPAKLEALIEAAERVLGLLRVSTAYETHGITEALDCALCEYRGKNE